MEFCITTESIQGATRTRINTQKHGKSARKGARNKISLNSIFEIKKVLGIQGLRGLHLAQGQSLEPEMVKSLFTFLNIQF